MWNKSFDHCQQLITVSYNLVSLQIELNCRSTHRLQGKFKYFLANFRSQIVVAKYRKNPYIKNQMIKLSHLPNCSLMSRYCCRLLERYFQGFVNIKICTYYCLNQAKFGKMKPR